MTNYVIRQAMFSNILYCRPNYRGAERAGHLLPWSGAEWWSGALAGSDFRFLLLCSEISPCIRITEYRCNIEMIISGSLQCRAQSIIYKPQEDTATSIFNGGY